MLFFIWSKFQKFLIHFCWYSWRLWIKIIFHKLWIIATCTILNSFNFNSVARYINKYTGEFSCKYSFFIKNKYLSFDFQQCKRIRLFVCVLCILYSFVLISISHTFPLKFIIMNQDALFEHQNNHSWKSHILMLIFLFWSDFFCCCYPNEMLVPIFFLPVILLFYSAQLIKCWK